jgi:hypothetical protein
VKGDGRKLSDGTWDRAMRNRVELGVLSRSTLRKLVKGGGPEQQTQCRYSSAGKAKFTNLGSGYLSLGVNTLHGAGRKVRKDEGKGPCQISER